MPARLLFAETMMGVASSTAFRNLIMLVRPRYSEGGSWSEMIPCCAAVSEDQVSIAIFDIARRCSAFTYLESSTKARHCFRNTGALSKVKSKPTLGAGFDYKFVVPL